MVKVIKRDGRVVDFDKGKIIKAIRQAMKQTEKGLDVRLPMKIAEFVENIPQTLTVEKIQDIVENKLMNSNRKDVAKEYIRYRHERSEYRNKVEGLDSKINELVELKENVANENANKDSKVFNTQRDLLAGITAKDYAFRNIIPRHIVNAHLNGDIHWHDADYNPFFKMYNCCLIDFKGMLKNGFSIGNAEIETPKSIKTATALVSQIVANVSSNIYGGTTFNRADEVLAPYAEMSYDKHLRNAKEWIVDKDGQANYAKSMTKKEIYDSMQSLEYEINTLYNSKQNWSFM